MLPGERKGVPIGPKVLAQTYLINPFNFGLKLTRSNGPAKVHRRQTNLNKPLYVWFLFLQAASDWLLIYPKGLRDLILYAKYKFKDPVIYITENGNSQIHDIYLIDIYYDN